MTAPALKVSTPADIGPIEGLSVLFALPFPQNGKTLVFKLRPLNGSDLAEIQAEPNDVARAEALARHGIVEPAVSFGDEREPGKVWWGDLIIGNQGGVILEINRISGMGQSPDREAANRTARFPEKPEGRPHGADAGPALPARKGAA